MCTSFNQNTVFDHAINFDLANNGDSARKYNMVKYANFYRNHASKLKLETNKFGALYCTNHIMTSGQFLES